jgi:hypothetical protein
MLSLFPKDRSAALYQLHKEDCKSWQQAMRHVLKTSIFSREAGPLPTPSYSCTFTIEMHNDFQTQNVSRISTLYCISMDTILFLDTTVHFASYARFGILHTGRGWILHAGDLALIPRLRSTDISLSRYKGHLVRSSIQRQRKVR